MPEFLFNASLHVVALELKDELSDEIGLLSELKHGNRIIVLSENPIVSRLK